MSGDYKVSRCTRRCHAQQRPLREGESYYSVVLEAGDDFVRRDYSAEAWEGPPETSIGWWKSRMPTAGERKLVLAPKEVLIDLLVGMGEVPAKEKTRYLLALLLMRRRLVRPVASPSPDRPPASAAGREGSPNADAGSTEKGRREDGDPRVHGDRETLRLEVIGSGTIVEVPVCEIGREESATLRDELNEWIHCEAEA